MADTENADNENDDTDRMLEIACSKCGSRGKAYISPANDLTEMPVGFTGKQDRGMDHTFTCIRCGAEAKIV